MFDISDPYLVFETQCVDIFDQHTGYIFCWYEPGEVLVRELFFSHIAEAQVFAKARSAVFAMHPGAKPRRVSVEDFLRNHESDSFGRSNWAESVNSFSVADALPETAPLDVAPEVASE